MRKLPDPALPARAGGYGMYYHFDYVGGGRNYKWVDTINLANTGSSCTWPTRTASTGSGWSTSAT